MSGSGVAGGKGSDVGDVGAVEQDHRVVIGLGRPRRGPRGWPRRSIPPGR
jgi:hypothetical protein